MAAAGISAPSIAKCENIQLEVLVKIYLALECKFADIMEMEVKRKVNYL